MSNSVRPHRRQPIRLPRPWDSPGKNTGVGCHFPLQCMKVKSENEVAQSCLTLSDPMDRSPPGSSVHGILQARIIVSQFFFKKVFIYFCLWLSWILVATCGIFSCGVRTLNCGIWDLVPCPGIEPGLPALEVQNFSHWTTREVPSHSILINFLLPVLLGKLFHLSVKNFLISGDV